LILCELAAILIVDAAIFIGTKRLESKEEEYRIGFVHSLLIFELNSVSYEEIVSECLKDLGSIIPVDGMIAEKADFSVSPVALGEKAPTPSRLNRWRDSLD